MVASDEGRDLANKVMAKEAGAEAAKELIDFITTKQAEAEYSQGQADAQEAIQNAIWEAGYKAATEKNAAAQPKAQPKAQPQLSAQDMEYIKLGQAIADQGVADLQAAAGPAAMAGIPPEAAGLPPEGAGLPPEAAGLPPEAAGLPPEAAGVEGGEGEISMEDLAAAIDQLVASGVIQPEEAQQIVEYLISAGEGGGAEVPGAEVPGAEAPVEAPAEAPEAEAADAAASAEGEGEAGLENVKESKEKSVQRISKLANALAVNIGAARAIMQQSPAKKQVEV